MEKIVIAYENFENEMAGLKARKLGENGAIELWYSLIYENFLECHFSISEDGDKEVVIYRFGELVNWDLQ